MFPPLRGTADGLINGAACEGPVRRCGRAAQGTGKELARRSVRTAMSMDADAQRGRLLVEESREAVVVIDDADSVLLASRRARQSIEGLREGVPLPDGLLAGDSGVVPARRPVRGRRPPRAARLPEPRRGHDGLRGASGGLHRRRLPRAPYAARAAARAPRDGVAAGRGRPRAHRAGAGRGRPGARADRRGALPLRARVGRAGRLARRGRGAAGARRPSSRSLGERASRAGVGLVVECDARDRRSRCGRACCA